MSEAVLLRWTTFCSELESFIVYAGRQEVHPNETVAYTIVERMENVLQSLRGVLEYILDYNPVSDEEVTSIREFECAVEELTVACQRVSSWWQDYIDTEQASDPLSLSHRYSSPVIHISGAQGRPRFDISKDQLEYLSSLSFSWTDIAAILGVSRMTIYRRRQEFNLPTRRDTLSDTELRQLIVAWKTEMPNIGVTMITGRVLASGHHVRRERIRQVIRRVDPLSTALRAPSGLTSRRPYSVPGPNCLWHIGKLETYLLFL